MSNAVQEMSQDFIDVQAALAGEYSLERELGRGGMGVVYLARDVQLDRLVAIKVLPSRLAESADAREGILREARTAARLSHPNIVPIHRVGDAILPAATGAAGTRFVFFVMTYVSGMTLGQRLRSHGPMSSADTMRVVREVAWALAYAHVHGVVHRDVKPDNILIEEGSGRAMVTDFGIARVDSTTNSMDAGRIMGTAHFMSPEQALGGPVDGRSDLYALGVVGYLAVSGRLPFDAPNLPALLLQHMTQTAPALVDVVPGVSPTLARAIEYCLQKDPSSRFSDGEELADALAPETEGRPELPLPLRHWLAERDPAQVAYVAFVGLLAVPFLSELSVYAQWRESGNLSTMALLASLAAIPVVPIIGFHARRAQRLFAAGFTLADIRGALDVAASEREQSDVLMTRDPMGGAAYALVAATHASIAIAVTVTFFLGPFIGLTLRSMHLLGFADNASSHQPQTFVRGVHWLFAGRVPITLTAWIAAVALLVACNVYGVPAVPAVVRRVVRIGLRARLWRSRVGAWLARRLGEPPTSRPVGAGVFRPTEVALRAALADLLAALPTPYQEQLGELPVVISALESRARAARKQVEMLDLVAKGMPSVDEAHMKRREDAKVRLGATVAALEAIRLDLWRLHAGAGELDPLTTVLDVAKRVGEDLRRLTAAQDEVAAHNASGRNGCATVSPR